MSAQYTPGPWEWDSAVWSYDPQNDAPWLVQSDGINAVLTGEIKCNEADAYLIAAAPELLDALQRVIKTYEGSPPTLTPEWVIAGRAAIAKATGITP